MSSDAVKLLEAALRLSPEDRAALVGSLLDSLDSTVDADADAAWEIEVACRIQDLDQGKTRTIPWAEVRRKIAGT